MKNSSIRDLHNDDPIIIKLEFSRKVINQWDLCKTNFQNRDKGYTFFMSSKKQGKF